MGLQIRFKASPPRRRAGPHTFALRQAAVGGHVLFVLLSQLPLPLRRRRRAPRRRRRRRRKQRAAVGVEWRDVGVVVGEADTEGAA
jgi:hypothetical protein